MPDQPQPGSNQTPQRRRRVVGELVAGMAALVGTLSIALTTERLDRGHELFPRPWDHHKYIEIASSELGSFHIAPYCWRIGAPLLAAQLPGSIQQGFVILSLTATWLIGMMLYTIARQLGFSSPLALAGMLLFYSLEWAPKLYLFDFWLPDAPAALMMTAAIWAIVTRRDWLVVVSRRASSSSPPWCTPCARRAGGTAGWRCGRPCWCCRRS
jgi:hypothetical protein